MKFVEHAPCIVQYDNIFKAEKFFEFIGLIFINPLLILNNSRIQSLILLGTYSLIP